MQPPSPDSQTSKTDKKANVAKKVGRVVPTAAKKTRPVITKRQSSQSSTDSTTKVEAQNANQSSAERTPPTFSEELRAKGKAPSRFQENFSPERLATQSPRKLLSSKPADPKRTSPRKQSRKGSSERREGSTPEVTRGEPGPSSGLRSIGNPQIPGQDMTEADLKPQRTLLEEANARGKKNTRMTPQPTSKEARNDDLHAPKTSLCTTSDGAQDQDIGAVGLLPHGAKSTARVVSTLAAATGQLDLGDTTGAPLPQVTGAKGENKGKGRNHKEVERTEMFPKRPVPPISGTAATPVLEGSLARSKSQLTLLLEKDRARSGEHKPRDEKKG